MIYCLEIGCPDAGTPDMALGTVDFTTLCSTANGADCQKLINGLDENGVFGVTKSDCLADEPNDGRQTAINAITLLDGIHPDQEDGASTFAIP